MGRTLGIAAARQFEELVAGCDAAAELCAHGLRGRLQVGVRNPLLVEAQPRLLPGRAAADRERPIVARRHEVDGRAKERALDDSALFERAGEVTEGEPLQPAPEPDVRRGGVLGLDAPDAFDGPHQRQPRPLEEELTREQGAIEVSNREHGLGHGCDRIRSIPPGAPSYALAARQILRPLSARFQLPLRGVWFRHP